MRLHIGCPTFGHARGEFAIDSGWNMMYHLGRNHPEIQEVHVMRDVRTYRAAARAGIVEEAQKWGATHLLMLDDDHDFTPEAVDLLLDSIHKDGVDVVTALYFTRGIPTVPCIWKLAGNKGTVPIFYYPKNELLKVDVVGFGMTLFRMSIFNEINPPYFDIGIGFGEDAAFCARLLQIGKGIYCHTGAKIGHLLENPYIITEEVYERMRHVYEQQPSAEPQLVQAAGPPKGVTPLKVVPGYEVVSRRWWRPRSRRVYAPAGAPARSGAGYAHYRDLPEEEGEES